MNKQEQYFLITDYDPVRRYGHLVLRDREQLQVDYQLHFTDPIKEKWEGETILYKFQGKGRKRVVADYHYAHGYHVFSDRIKELIESLNVSDIDFLEAAIIDKKVDMVTTIIGYSVMHVRRLIACFNKEKSRWKPPVFDPNKVMSIDNMVLDMDRLEKIPLQERLIFRLEECVHYHLFHESVVDAIAALEPAPTGFRFVSVGAWHSAIGWELSK